MMKAAPLASAAVSPNFPLGRLAMNQPGPHPRRIAPQMHIAYTLAGAAVGYGFHELEEKQQREAAANKSKHAKLLAEQLHSVQAQLGPDHGAAHH